MNNTGIILTLAYPDTIVSHAEEWYSPYLKYIGIGNKTSVRAGHAALVLIDKKTGVLEYHDFGRYITSEPNGRVRGSDTDNELHFPLKALIEDEKVLNLKDILKFLGTNPKLTHGDGVLIASVCSKIDYEKARTHISSMQARDFIYYAAFKKNACNCARFVTDSLIASVTDAKIVKRLKKSKWFTPSTVGNVLLANTEDNPFKVTDKGEISKFEGSQTSENLRCFLDRLKGYEPNLYGTQHPKQVEDLHEKAQWLSGIAAGAWFELHYKDHELEFDFRRISPYGNIDVHETFKVEDSTFNYHLDWKFIHYSNCKFFHIEQNGKIYRFNKKTEI